VAEFDAFKEEVSLPEDGSELYVMNEAGDSIHSYYWPPRPTRRERGLK